MSNEQITINFENLNADERNQLMTLIEKANTPQKEWYKNTEFDILSSDIYYTIMSSGEIFGNAYDYDNIDRDRKYFGNACKDRAYMEQRAKEIKRSNLIANFAHVVNDGWEADWSDICNKFYIYYDNDFGKWYVNCCSALKLEGVTCFKSKETAQRCIDEIILPLERGEL